MYRTLFPFLLILALAAPAVSQTAVEDVFAELSELRLDRGHIHRVRDLTIRRDVLSVSFTRGVLAFLEPVDGRVTGAVFFGSGEVLAIPPDEVERRQLFKFTESPILNERFSAAILRFTDDTSGEILELLRNRAQEEVRADDIEDLIPWEANLGESSRLLNFRLLTGLMGDGGRPFFFAALRGDRVGWFDVSYDEARVEEVVIGASGVGPDANRQEVWASFNKRAETREPERFRDEDKSVVDVLSYNIETTIHEDASLEAEAYLTVRSMVGGERVLHFDLTRTLRLSEVRLGGEPIVFHQHPPLAEGSRNLDSAIVVLPRPTRVNEEWTLEFRYAGRMLERRGEGIFYVRERSAWYPKASQDDGALYEMSFRHPARYTLVATGRKLDEVESEGYVRSTWTSGGELFLAGFNYGDFSVESDQSGAIPVFIYSNRDVEAIYKDIETQRALETEDALRTVFQGPTLSRGTAPPRLQVDPDFDMFSTQRIVRNMLSDVRSTLEFFTERLGDYPFHQLNVSQFPVSSSLDSTSFSQGWPSLLFASTFSFFDREQKARLGFIENERYGSSEFVLAHEIAHQWFGNKVGWRSYRDQWISEGFSNYASLMYLEQKQGETFSEGLLSELRDRLLTSTGAGLTPDDNGPLWLGSRLATVERPDGYIETIYPKSTWVVHMLRMLMRDDSPSDERFLAMLNAFLDDFAGRPASTWDLKDTAERFMSDRMDISGDGTLDWFFDQWVFGTGVPRYELQYGVEADGVGFVVSGRVHQGVTADFVMPVPLYARTALGTVEFLGEVVVSGEGQDFRFDLEERPVEVLLDPYDTVLRRP